MLREMRLNLIVTILVISCVVLSAEASLEKTTNVQYLSDSFKDSFVLDNNTALLNGNVTYYTYNNNTLSGSTTIYSTDYNVQWYFTGEAVSPNLSSEYKYLFNVGNYSYAGGNIQVPMVFEPGVDSSGGFNIGTIYSTLNIRKANNGDLLSSLTWSETVNLSSSSPGWSGWNPSTYLWAYIEPTFYPDVPEGYYSFSLSVAALPSTNYAEGSPGNLFTTPDAAGSSGGGFIATNESVTLKAPTDVMVGITYTGQSSSVNVNLNNSYGGNVSFKSPYPVALKIGKKISNDATSSYVYFFSSSPTNSISMTFQNVQFPTNGSVTQFSIEWYVSGLIIKNEVNNQTFTSLARISNVGHWWNTTNLGGRNYSFKLVSPYGALNGKLLYGTKWNTTWSYQVSHLVDIGFGSLVNDFYINYKQILYPSKYNQITGSITNSGEGQYIYVNLSTESLVYNYQSYGPPKIVSANASPNPVQVNESVFLYADVEWQGETGNLSWEVNGYQLKGDTYKFQKTGKYDVEVTAKNEYGADTLNFNVTVFKLPTIIKIGGIPANISVGETVAFNADVDWNGDNGTILWQVDGVHLLGHNYTFTSPGTYVVTLVAYNEYGNTTDSFYVNIKSPNNQVASNNTIFYAVGGALGICFLTALLIFRKHRA